MQNLNTLNEKDGAGGYSLKQLVDGIKATVKEVAPGVTVEEVLEKTAGDVIVAEDVKTMPI